MAREMGVDAICVNAVVPGFTLTEYQEKGLAQNQKLAQETIDSRCLKRHERPEDLLGTVVFLCSDDSDFMTGQTLVVDGGRIMH